MVEKTPKVLAGTITTLVWKRENKIRRSKTGDRYLEANYHKAPLTTAWLGADPNLALGFACIVRCRIGGLRMGSWLAIRGLISNEFRTRCPCCGTQVSETLSHALLSCPKWDAGRNQLLAESIAEARTTIGATADSGHGPKPKGVGWLVYWANPGVGGGFLAGEGPACLSE